MPAPSPTVAATRDGRRRPPPVVLRAIRGLRDGPTREGARRTWSLGALATALTLLFFGVLGSAVVSLSDLTGPERSTATTSAPTAAPPERIVFVPVPEAQRPLPTEAPALPRPTPAPPSRIARELRAPRDTSASPGAPIATPPARQRDSSALTPTSSGVGAPVVERPRVVFPTQPCDLNCEVKRGAASAKGGMPPSLSEAQRDSVRRDVARRVTQAPRGSSGPAGPPVNTNAPPPLGGVSLPIGLPGGGPSAAQRKRARELDADVSARLARIKARADSIQRVRDSVAAAAKRKQ